MANLKQKFIKPGRDFNYSEGVKVKATEAIYADQVVYVDGSDGPFLTVSIANATLAAESRGRLMVAKHAIAAGSYGIVLPWKLVTNFNTLAGSVGDPVYLSGTPGSATASNLTLTAPANGKRQVIIGRVTVDATAGAVLLWPGAPESESSAGGDVTPGARRYPAETMTFLVLFDNTTADNTLTFAPFAIRLLDAYIVNGEDDAVNLVVKDNGDNACLTTGNTATTTNAIARATSYVPGAADIAAGQTITLSRGGTRKATDYAVITCIRE
jgi:hypothetical protein